MKNIDRNQFKQLYWENGLTLNETALKLGIGTCTLCHKIKQWGEKTRGFEKTIAHRDKISNTRKERKINWGKKPPNGNRSWYKCPDGQIVSMRSNWEVNYAEWLTANKISWNYEPKTFKMEDGKTYTPDFYLSQSDEYIEVKGWFRPGQKERLEKFKKEYPNIKLVIADKDYMESIGCNINVKHESTCCPNKTCLICGKDFIRKEKCQITCSTICRNKYIATHEPIVKEAKEKRAYNGRQSGECNNCSKLTEQQVISIHQMRKQGMTLQEISDIIGASFGNTGNILSGRSWKHIYEKMK